MCDLQNNLNLPSGFRARYLQPHKKKWFAQETGLYFMFSHNLIKLKIELIKQHYIDAQV